MGPARVRHFRLAWPAPFLLIEPDSHLFLFGQDDPHWSSWWDTAQVFSCVCWHKTPHSLHLFRRFFQSSSVCVVVAHCCPLHFPRLEAKQTRWLPLRLLFFPSILDFLFVFFPA